jgi:hypothetical protein
MGEKVVRKFSQGPFETITADFVGNDGLRYDISIHGDRLYVNGQEMQSREDSPCEYARQCSGANGGCSRERLSLDKGPDEACAMHTDRKLADGYEWAPDKGWVKKAQ